MNIYDYNRKKWGKDINRHYTEDETPKSKQDRVGQFSWEADSEMESCKQEVYLGVALATTRLRGVEGSRTEQGKNRNCDAVTAQAGPGGNAEGVVSLQRCPDFRQGEQALYPCTD